MISRCPFCTLDGSQIVLENEKAQAIYDLYPVQKGHLLIVPKRHVQSYFEATEEEILGIHQLIKEGKGIIDSK
jgi:diadenosine tetraphosphate (Ap4A) HIT family hydrolase